MMYVFVYTFILRSRAEQLLYKGADRLKGGGVLTAIRFFYAKRPGKSPGAFVQLHVSAREK